MFETIPTRPLPLPAIMPVAGVSFHQDVLVSARPQDELEIVADPGNEYDPNACAVLFRGEIIGHVPRGLAPRLNATGASRWAARIVEVLRGGKTTGLRIEVTGALCTTSAGTAVDGLATVSGSAPAAVQSEAGDPELRGTAARSVHANSGRRLGRYLGTVDGSVSLMTDDGRVVCYPSSLVRLD